MKLSAIIVSVCLGLAAAGTVKRQTFDQSNDVNVTGTDTGDMNTTVTQTPDQPPVPETTTRKPTINEIVSVDEIIQVFKQVSNSTYFKKLPIEHQTIVLEILAAGETAMMTPVLEQMETKKLLGFLYNMPYKYGDSLWRLINLGYTREEIVG